MGMNAGRLIDRVIVEKVTNTRDDTGDPVPSWSSFAARWAEVVPGSASEVFRSRQDVSIGSHVVNTRLLPGVRGEHRVLWRKGEQTVLKGLVSSSATTAYVDSVTEFPSSPFLVLIDSEVIKVTAGFGSTTWTISRAQDGTTAAAHGTDTRVDLLTVLDVEAVQHTRDSTHLLCTERESGYGI